LQALSVRGLHPSLLAALLLAGITMSGRLAQADGLHVSESVSGMEYATPEGQKVDLLVLATTARVSRGRAGLSFTVPEVWISGGSIALADETYAITNGPRSSRFGLGDMQGQLDYNIIQNREHMFILTASTTLQFPTASTALAIGTGEYVWGVGLSAAYGITRKLIAFADAREGWVAVLTPLAERIQSADLGAVYWLTDKFGVNASLLGADYAGRVPPSLELNAGVSAELFPGFMANLGGIGGLAGSAPQFGLAAGFGFEI
jgi:hypothetical protein